MMRMVGWVLGLGLVVGSLPSGAQEWPPAIKNLKVLPEESSAQEVLTQMRGFAFALGVRCQYCHVGEENMPVQQFDFAADAKDNKAKARKMLQMTRSINQEHLATLGDLRSGLEVSCVTCHRGIRRPEQLHSVLARVVAEEGRDASLDRYNELREEYYGSGSYDFSEGSLVQAAEQVLENQPEAAAAFLELNMEHFPESSWTAGTLVGVYEQLQRPDDALVILRKMLERSPDDERLKRNIERLEKAQP